MSELSEKMRFFIDSEKAKGSFQGLTKDERKNWFVNRMLKEPIDVHIHHTENTTIPTRDGAQLPAHIIHPNGETKRPIILFFGGGLLLTSDSRHLQKQLSELAITCNSTVVAVDYRMEEFPTPVNDCIDAINWAKENAQTIDSRADNIVLCGDGFGASIIASAVQVLKDTPISIKGICLFYPILDPFLKTSSKQEFAENYLLEVSWLEYFYKKLIANHGVTIMSSPLHGENFENHPPTYIVKAEFDPLRDEAKLYGEKLQAAGVKVFSRVEGNTIHGFFSLPGIHTKKTMQIIHDVDHFLKSL